MCNQTNNTNAIPKVVLPKCGPRGINMVSLKIVSLLLCSLINESAITGLQPSKGFWVLLENMFNYIKE